MSIEKAKTPELKSSSGEVSSSSFNPDKQMSLNETGLDSNKETKGLEKTELTDSDRSDLMNETGWSQDLVDSMRWSEEADVYKGENLSEKNVDGRPILQRSDIDPNFKVEGSNLTNKQRMEKGQAPIVDGKSVELHHIGQKMDSPLAEMTKKVHNSEYKTLHEVPKEGRQRKSNIDRPMFDKEKIQYWKTRAEDF